MNALLKDFPQTPLSFEQEQTALAAGETEKIVLHAMIPAFRYVKQYCKSQFSDSEIVSLCYTALSETILRFKPNQQDFLTYSKSELRGELSWSWRDRDIVKNSSLHEKVLGDEPTIPRPEEAALPEFDAIHFKELWKLVEPFIRSTLTRKEIAVLELRYRADMTLDEIGKRMGGLSRARINQIHREALGKLRRVLPNREELF